MMSSLHTSPFRLALAAAALAACGGGSSGRSGDAGITPGDTAVAIDSIVAPDSISATDATATDATPVDASSRVSVTVLTVTGDGQPDPTARVIFADPSNQLVKQDLVGALGDISADMPLGGFVHVVSTAVDMGNSRSVGLQSIRVKPGDSITFGVAATLPQGAPITLQGTFVPVPNLTTLYQFAHPCGGGSAAPADGTVAHLTSLAGCLPATFDVLGATEALPSAGPIPHFVWFTATPAGGFAAPAMQEMPAFAAKISNVRVTSAVTLSRATLIPPYFNDAASVFVQINRTTGTTVAASLFYPPPPPGSAAIGMVQATISTTQFGRTQQILRTRVAGTAASVDLDLESLSMPVVQTPPLRSGKLVRWGQSSGGLPDLREVTTSSTYTAGGLNYLVSWTVIDGGNTDSLELPGLPEMFAEIDPTQQPGSTPGDGEVLYVKYSNIGGFDHARLLPLGSVSGFGPVPMGAGLFAGELYSARASRD